jgi:hypothetical protein
MIESIIRSLLYNHKIKQSDLLELYLASTDDYERKLLSMTDRIAGFFLLTYGDDFEIAKDSGQLVVSFYKYYSEDPIAIYITHSNDINEYTITFEDGNSVTYINPLYAEKTIRDYYKT